RLGAEPGTPDLTSPPLAQGALTQVTVTYNRQSGARALWLGTVQVASDTLDPAVTLGLGQPRHALELGGAAGAFTGAIARLLLLPGEVATPQALAERPRRTALDLFPQGGARFWRPRDPVIALKGEAAAATGRHGRGPLPVHERADPAFDALDDATRAGQAAALPALTQALAGLAAQDPDDLGLHKTDGAPWHPIALEWETALHPMASSGPLARQTARYAPDDLTAAYDLAPDGPDLVPKPRVMPLEGYATVTSGRAVLTPYAHAMLQDRQRVAEMAGLDPSLLPTAAAQDHSDTQSQALGGFHSALLQRREAMAIPPDDPLAPDGPNEDTRALSRDRIAAALRRSGAGLALSAASPNQPFVPLRAGRLSLRRLRLIDAFGQIRDLSTGLTARAGRLDTLPAAAHDTYLPPRLAQPARLNFRWLSASSGLVEATEEASSTPVCGWLSVSPMEAALAVHASDGRALGEIAPGAPAPWQPAPGEAGMPPEA
ncbi:MAG: hypothetical protein AAF245_10820, partial [Pseudomonadota bacterium]